MAYIDLTKDELQQELEQRDLKKSGTKDELIERLEQDDERDDDGGGVDSDGDRPRRLRAAEAVARAAHQLGSLRGRPVEGVSGFERTADGWRVLIEIVEVSRVPASTDVLGAYEVTLDREGELVGYERLRRYGRTQTGEDAL